MARMGSHVDATNDKSILLRYTLLVSELKATMGMRLGPQATNSVFQ
jgi:hypothetical protein